MFKVTNVKYRALIYLFSNVLSSALPVLILPYLSNHLTVEDYGILTNFSLVILFLSFYIGFQTSSYLQRQYFVVDHEQFRMFFFNVLLIGFISILPLLILYPIYSRHVRVFFNGLDFLFPVLIIGLSNFFITLLAVQKQMEENALFVLILRVVQCAAEVALTYFFIENSDDPLLGRIDAMWIANGSLAIFCMVYIFRRYINIFNISWDFIKDALKFGIPIFFNLIFGWIMTSSSRFFLSIFATLQLAGKFSFSYQLAMVISLIGNSVNQAWAPWLFKKLARSSSSDIYSIRKGVFYSFGVIVLSTILFIIVVPIFVPFFFNQVYDLDLIVFSLIAIGFSLNTCYRILVNFMFFEKNTKGISVITFICASMNVVLSYFAIPPFGAIGAAVSTCISFGIGLLIIIIIVNKKKYLKIGIPNEEAGI